MGKKFGLHESVIIMKSFVLLSVEIVLSSLVLSCPETRQELHGNILDKYKKPTLKTTRNSVVADITLGRDAKTQKQRKTINNTTRGIRILSPSQVLTRPNRA